MQPLASDNNPCTIYNAIRSPIRESTEYVSELQTRPPIGPNNVIPRAKQPEVRKKGTPFSSSGQILAIITINFKGWKEKELHWPWFVKADTILILYERWMHFPHFGIDFSSSSQGMVSGKSYSVPLDRLNFQPDEERKIRLDFSSLLRKTFQRLQIAS